ncbi:MAG: hypothetical protein NC342_08385 [Pseudoflavonifractor sp.]|nr:hypothetical protein [Alloprevotella sp.]MCM1117538.1 hypothetical protein [Pseudoflavonifractor sp.]
MAKFEILAPFILHFESGADITAADSVARAFEKAKGMGVETIRGDRGGATLCGVTLATYRAALRKPGATAADLAQMTYCQWLAIAKGMIWDKLQCDRIEAQCVANQICDWAYTAGVGNAVGNAQRALGVMADGVIGPVTLGALNAPDHLATFEALKRARQEYYCRIARRGNNRRFLAGWLARTDAITPTGLRYR